MKIGTMLGSGGVIVMDETTCMVSGSRENITDFIMRNHVANAHRVERVQVGCIEHFITLDLEKEVNLT